MQGPTTQAFTPGYSILIWVNSYHPNPDCESGEVASCLDLCPYKDACEVQGGAKGRRRRPFTRSGKKHPGSTQETHFGSQDLFRGKQRAGFV